MNRTVQCPTCGVLLNVPAAAAGRRLKCPQCQTKFAPPALGPGDSAIAQPSAGSSLLSARGVSSGSIELPVARPKSSGSTEIPASHRRSSGDSVELPIPTGSLRETFDLPLLSDDTPKVERPRAAANPAPAADVLGLFKDEPKSARKPKGAEARAHARRCPDCGGVVGVGMSLCNTCGLDLDTGQRVVVDLIEEEAPAAPRAPAPSLGVIFVGSLCALGYALLSAISVVAWAKGQDGAQFLLIVWMFGLYASAQFLRRKSLRPLFIALGLAAGIGTVFLIALPIYQANMTTSAPPITEQGLVTPDDLEGPHIRPITDQLDMNRIVWGIFSLLTFAGLAVYLNTPSIRREFRH